MPTEPKRRAPKKPKAELSPAQVTALDRDLDGYAGGSLPKALGEHELAGLSAEAFEAYDYQSERIRFDTKGRRWWFTPHIRNNLSELLLQVKRLDDVREAQVSTALLASDLGRDLVADEVRALDKALA